MAPTQTDFEGSPLVAHIHDPDEENLPSIKFGLEFFAAVFALVVFVAALVVMASFYCVHRADKRKESRAEATKEAQDEDFKSKLDCKPWCEEDATEEMSMSDDSFRDFACRTSSAVSDVSTMEAVSEGEEEDDLEMGGVVMNGCPMVDKDGTCCPICSEVFEYGQPVYTSNNCSHQCHKVCMDKWLKFQNTCPICNKPFVNHTR
ncbi:expressed unknown protein [Seminavis robusta]|uniref:RING-type domain-containing protein n=1 Tax=Seminavis robusta TaxID=568900 RepID=A0A9N8EH40_9STRA|nr:expressed unknown protein [Seminavis robusta]|eukprot:Sro1123_g243690.1 n/a (204) ;mRNA; r:23976-24679